MLDCLPTLAHGLWICIKVDQVSPGRFAGRHVVIRVSGIEVIRETTTQALIKQGAAWPDVLVFSLPLAASNDGHFNGRSLAFPNVLLSDGADLPSLVTSTELDVVSIAVARERLSSSLDALGEKRAADFVASYRQQHHLYGGLPRNWWRFSAGQPAGDRDSDTTSGGRLVGRHPDCRSLSGGPDDAEIRPAR